MKETERKGRIHSQQRSRKLIEGTTKTFGFSYHAIGHIESPFPDRRGTPRQPQLVSAAHGKIRFDKSHVQFDHFKELAEFSHIWVIFIFHVNTNIDSTSSNDQSMNSKKPSIVPAKIKPPRLHGVRVGCLSTRSPHRPNNLGLSVCEVLGVGEDYIEVAGLDMVDGTPVLDVKPYIPYDSIPFLEPLPMMPNGDSPSPSPSVSLSRRPLSVPSWIYESDIELLEVEFSPLALSALQGLFPERERGAKGRPKVSGRDCCSSSEQAQLLISQVLRQDIRGFRQGRGKPDQNNKASNEAQGRGSPYMCRLAGLRVYFSHLPRNIQVDRICEDNDDPSLSLSEEQPPSDPSIVETEGKDVLI